MQVVIRFDPRDAHVRVRQRREQHAEMLSALPAEAIRIDTGLAVGGDFVQVSVDDETSVASPQLRIERELWRHSRTLAQPTARCLD